MSDKGGLDISSGQGDEIFMLLNYCLEADF